MGSVSVFGSREEQAGEAPQSRTQSIPGGAASALNPRSAKPLAADEVRR
jgi:hypothetical protein